MGGDRPSDFEASEEAIMAIRWDKFTVKSQEAVQAAAFQTYLTAHLPASKIAIINAAIANHNPAIISDAIKAEQLGPIDATFTGITLIWA